MSDPRKQDVARLMTQNAQRANVVVMTLEGMVQKCFRTAKVDITAPEQSTAGGKRALQRIRLQVPQGPLILIGEFNTVEKRGELRSLGYVQEVHRRRFNVELPIDPKEYFAFIETAKQILDSFGMPTTIAAAPAPGAESSFVGAAFTAESAPPLWPWIVGVGVIVLAAASVAAWFLFGR